jgi:histidinol-phosphate aminotransferase
MNLDAALLCINPSVRALRAYHLSPDRTEIKLNQNENPFDWPGSVKDELARYIIERPWNRYPDFIPEDLKNSLASYAGIKPDNIIVGNGSNEMLLVLMMSLLSLERPLITCQPTFTVYGLLASGMGRKVVNIPLTAGLDFDVNAICNACTQNPGAVLLLCTPNNPTGGTLGEKDIYRILETHDGFVILDQAYIEFGGFSAITLINRFPNLIVTRTFSKAFGAAGLRLGYMAGTEKVIAELNKIKLPYNINFFSDRAATVLLSHKDVIKERINYIIEERGRIMHFLRAITDIKTYESLANFILIRTDRKAELFNAMHLAGILVRDVSSYPMLENCLRISIGSKEENDRLMKSISDFFSISPV